MNRKSIISFFIFITCILGRFVLNAQESYEKLKPAFIIRLSEHIDWPEESYFDEFIIGLLWNDTATFNQLSKRSLILKERPIKTVLISDIQSIDKINVLFVSKDNIKNVDKIAQAIERKNILLITEGSTDLKNIMLNLIVDKQSQSVSFQINKANIIIENLQIDPDLLLLGGTTVDIRNVYRNMKVSLDEQEKEIKKQQVEIAAMKKEIEDEKEKIKELLEVSLNQTREIIDNEGKLSVMHESITLQENKISSQSSRLIKQQSKFDQQLKSLHTQDSLIQIKENQLAQLNRTRIKNEEFIKLQENVLNVKEERISSQSKLLMSSVIALVLFLGLGVTAFFAYKTKHKLSGKLKKSNEELNISNRQLLEQKEEINSALDQLQSAQEQLIQSEKLAALGVLISGVAHEINNPLNYIKSGSSILRALWVEKGEVKSANTKQKIDDVLKYIDVGTNRIVKIVKGLHSYSRQESDELTDCDVHDIINSSLALLEHEYKKRIDVFKEFHQKPIFIKADETKLYQIFTNLILNAIQAITKKGSITIDTSTQNDQMTTIITDTGCGIKPKVMKSIMDPFFTTKDPGKGTGLGLSIVHNLISGYDGKIDIKSKVNQGTTITVTLPLGS